MRYDRHYVGKSEEELDADAIKDFEEYASDPEYWDKILATVREPETTYPKWVLACSFFVGVEGRPVNALWRRERGEVPEEEVQIKFDKA